MTTAATSALDRRPLQVATALVLALVLAVALAPRASADTLVHPFAAVDDTVSGCDGVRIASITESIGVDYYLGGTKLTFPTGLLPFTAGDLDLTARLRPGYALADGATDHHRISSSTTDCRTPITAGVFTFPQSPPSGQWCRNYAASPSVVLTFDGPTAAPNWAVADKTGKVWAHGQVDPGTNDFLELPRLPADAPAGAYEVQLSLPGSPQLHPAAVEVFNRDCVTATAVTCTTIRIVNPASSPSAHVTLWTDWLDDQLTSVEIPPGRSVDVTPGAYAPARTSYYFQAGGLGSGYVAVPACHPVVGTPTIHGGAVVGKTLVASVGSWGPGPVTHFSYQWYRGSRPVTDARGKTYTVGVADLGARLSVEVTGGTVGYPARTRRSTASAPVLKGTLTEAPTPTVAGATTVGATLTATPGSWQPAPVTLTHRWQRDGQPIAGATGLRYRLTPADAGSRISFRVAGRKAGYWTRVTTSVATTQVTR